MIKRLFDCLNRQMIRLEQAQERESDKNPDTDEERRRKSREIVEMQRTLDRLTNMELRRIAARARKVVADDDDARAALERRLDQRLAAFQAAESAEGSDE